MKPIGTFLALLLLGLLCACATESGTRDKLLEQTPVGSSMAQIKDYCSRQNLQCRELAQTGYDLETGKVTGRRYIRAIVAQYHPFPLAVRTVEAQWICDVDGRLLDVTVWSADDSL